VKPDSARRRELRDSYHDARREAGVYLIRNERTGRVLVGTSPDLTALRNRFQFAQATGSIGGLDGRLAADARTFGLDAFSLEVVDTIAVEPDTTPEQLRADLDALLELWSERLETTDRW
jgi:hypothetical protein